MSVATAELRRIWGLTTTLAVSEFKARYFGSVFGYLWTLAKPLMLFGVLYVAFTHFIRFGGGIEHYPAYLLMAIVLWTFFAETTGTAVGSLVAHEALIRKMPVPLIVIPLSIVMTASINLGLNLLAVFGFVLANDVEVTWRWIEFPLLVAALVVFSTAVSALVANLYVPFRDMKPIWEVVLQVGFWGTPIIYTFEAIPDSVDRYMMWNPLATIMTQMRHAVIDPEAPSAIEAIGGVGWLAVPFGIGVVILVASLWLHRRVTPRLAERL